MSRLIFRGNTVKNFGEYLPVPHIERIYVYDDKITIELSYMLTLVEGQDEDELLERLNNVAAVLYMTTGTGRPENLLSKEYHPLTFLAMAELFDDFDDNDYAMVPFSEFESTGDYLYDTSGNKILKLITTVDTTSADDHEAGTFGMLVLDAIADGDETELTLYAFSMIGDGGDVDLGDVLTRVSNNRTLGDQNTSDVAYEIIFEGGLLLGQPEIIWVTTPSTAGIAPQPFDGIPLQALGSAKYYTPEVITHKEITESFNELVDEYSTQAETDTVLESVVDSISYVLAVYGTEPDLLPRLDVLRKAWPDKSRATFTGKLYKKFKGKLQKANIAVSNGILLHKQLVLNPKIIDVREPPMEEYYSGEIQELDDDEYLYDDQWSPRASIKQFASTGAESVAEEYGGGVISDYTMVDGFFFFDYEKLMTSGSNITAFFNIAKIDQHYGKGFLNSYLTVDNVNLIRYDDDDSGQAMLKMYMPTYYERAPFAATSRITENTTLWTGGDLISEVETDGETEYSYLNIRNFDFAAGETIGGEPWDYRLMMFEFQDIRTKAYSYADMDSFFSTETGPDDFYYKAYAYVTDNTVDVVKALTSSYYSYYTGSLQDYYDLANEYCSYNDVDGKFNRFFTDAVMAAYVDNMEEAPWVRLPVVYNIHLDLLFNTYDGDTAEIINASKIMTDHIDPYQGNIERIDNFKNKFESLYDNYYASGDIATLMEVDYDTSKSFEVTFSDFPVVYDETYEAQALAYALVEETIQKLEIYLEEFTDYWGGRFTSINSVISDVATLFSDVSDASSVDTLEELALELESLLKSGFNYISPFADPDFGTGGVSAMFDDISALDAAVVTDAYSTLEGLVDDMESFHETADDYYSSVGNMEWGQGNPDNVTRVGVNTSESAWAWYAWDGEDGVYYAHAANSREAAMDLISTDDEAGWYWYLNNLTVDVWMKAEEIIAVIQEMITEVEATAEDFGF